MIWVTIAYIGAGDQQTQGIIEALLHNNKIEVQIFGSVYYCVQVHNNFAHLATRLLQAAETLKGRWIHFGELSSDRI